MIIWLSSYPKSGNTWVRSFLSNYLSTKENFEFDQLNTILKFPNKKIIKELENNQGFNEKGKNIFFRKGKVGDWKKNLSLKVRADMEKIFNVEMKELKYL